MNLVLEAGKLHQDSASFPILISLKSRPAALIMATPRRSARVAASDSSPNYNENEPVSGRKRKSEPTGSSPAAKRGKKGAPKKQQTIEDAMDVYGILLTN